MAKNQKTAAQRSAAAKVSRLRAQLAAAEEEEREALEEEEEVETEEEEDTTAEGEEEDVTSEGDEEDVTTEGEEEDVTSEDEEEDITSEDEEGKTPAARSKLRKLAIAGLPEAQKNPAYAKALAEAGLSVKAAQKALRAANRTNALSGRKDRGVQAGGASGKMQRKEG